MYFVNDFVTDKKLLTFFYKAIDYFLGMCYTFNSKYCLQILKNERRE